MQCTTTDVNGCLDPNLVDAFLNAEAEPVLVRAVVADGAVLALVAGLFVHACRIHTRAVHRALWDTTRKDPLVTFGTDLLHDNAKTTCSMPHLKIAKLRASKSVVNV